MKGKFICYLMILLCIISFSACTKKVKVVKNEEVINLSEELHITKIEEDAYVVEHEFPWGANSLIMKMNEREVLMVDTPYTPEATDKLLKWINNEFDNPTVMAINTHFHVDNLGGNEALISSDIPIYGSDFTVELLKEKGEESRQLMMSWLKDPKDKKYYEGHKSIPYIEPTHRFNILEKQVLTFEGEKVEIFYPGEGHAPDNVVVYFPKRKILFGGCIVKSLDSKKLGNVADANVEVWPKSLKKLLDTYDEAKIVIPGHGQVGGLDLIEHSISLFDK